MTQYSIKLDLFFLGQIIAVFKQNKFASFSRYLRLLSNLIQLQGHLILNDMASAV